MDPATDTTAIPTNMTHGGDLALGGAMNAGIGTACLPTIQIGLGLLQALKAFSL
jgi:hypothetical protein